MRLDDFIPVFHRWIQKQTVSGHLLIDVHDYSHIHQGPGILLVGHEGNFSIDLADGTAWPLLLPQTTGRQPADVLRPLELAGCWRANRACADGFTFAPMNWS